MIPGAANPLLLVSAAPSYQIERSLRFNSSDSAYLSKNFGSAGNRKTWTWAGWVKRGLLNGTTTYQQLFSAGIANTVRDVFFFDTDVDDTLAFYSIAGLYGATLAFRTNAVFRDPSAWYHIVLVLDTPNATSTDRFRLYVNGLRQTFSTYVAPTQNADSLLNSNTNHAIGRDEGSDSQYLNGYLADIHFIDGQALDPTSFGEFDTNGVWQPIEYTGTYGTNGFHLPFSDNSTAAALGTDTSGAGNNWTVNNISVAAGAGNDSLVDTPTSYGTDTGAGGEVRGNYATLNPLHTVSTGGTFSNGNLDFTAYNRSAASTIAVSSGKWYFEGVMTATSDPGDGSGFGIYNTAGQVGYIRNETTPNFTSTIPGVSSISPFGSNFTTGDLIGVAFDADAGTLQFTKNGSGYGALITGIPGGVWYLFSNTRSSYTLSALTVNFGQRPFAYPAPSGFKALCTTNLPEPQTITTSGSYTGNGVADGPFVYLNGVPTAMTVNGNAVTFGTHADKLSNGFKVRTTSTTYNQNAAVYNYSITSTGDPFKVARAQSNP